MRFTLGFNKGLVFFALAVPLATLAAPLFLPFSWRGFVPLPPLPTRTSVYTVRDIGVTNSNLPIYSAFPELMIRPEGTVRVARDSDYETFFALKKRFETRFHPSVVVQGYENWGFYNSISLTGVNPHGDIIGSGRLDTESPSCTHPYYGHGRTFGVVWRDGFAKADDLNTLVAERSGWYIVAAFDITDRGEILCLACKTDAKGAEHRNGLPEHLVVLTPSVRVR